MFQKLLTGTLLTIAMILPMASLAGGATKVVPGNYNPAKPHMVFTNDCVAADTIVANVSGNSSGTYGQKNSSCPAGYAARTFQANVEGGFGTSYSKWNLTCCKTIISYM